MQQWESFNLSGLPALGTITIQQITRIIPAFYNAPDSTHGIRIIFNKNSKYAEFIHLLNAVNGVGIHRYAFQIRTSAPTFYIFEDKTWVPNQHLLPPK